MSEKTYIPGGYILLSRRLIESEIWDKPPMYLKVWIYILTKARHKANNNFDRGELLISIPEIQEACSHKVGYRTVKPTKGQIYNIIQWLRSANEGICEDNYENNYEDDTNTTMIATTKTTRGMVVKVRNYNVYQDPNNYEDNDEHNSEDVTNETTNTTTKTLRRQRQLNTIHKNVKNEKNVKKEKNEKKKISACDFYQQNGFGILNQYTAENIGMYLDSFQNDSEEILIAAMKIAIDRNKVSWGYAKKILDSWTNKNLNSINEVRAFEKQQQAVRTNARGYKLNATQSKEITPDWLLKGQHEKRVGKNRKPKKNSDDPTFERDVAAFKKYLQETQS